MKTVIDRENFRVYVVTPSGVEMTVAQVIVDDISGYMGIISGKTIDEKISLTWGETKERAFWCLLKELEVGIGPR